MHVDVHRVHPYYTHNRDLDYTHGVHNMSIIILNNDVHEYSSYTGQICHQRDSEWDDEEQMVDQPGWYVEGTLWFETWKKIDNKETVMNNITTALADKFFFLRQSRTI